MTHITQREDAIYHSTYTGRPPDEPAVLGVALNEVFVPILQKQFPEIVDFLPAAGRLFLSSGGSDDQKTVRRTREARHDGRLVVLTPVYVH